MGLVSGAWYRFTEYSLKDGYICPAEDAELLRYDPWSEYTIDNFKKKDSPYYRLINLYQEMGCPSRLESISEAEIESLLIWCSNNGLLGILLQAVKVVSFIPPGTFRNFSAKGSPITRSRSTYVKTSTGWQHVWEPLKPDIESGEFSYYQRIGDVAVLKKPLKETWALFFPGVPQKELYKYVPTEKDSWKERFWQVYAEPVDEFLRGISILHHALESLSYNSDDDWPDGKAEVFTDGLNALNALTEGVSPILSPLDKTFEQSWTSPSLLASYAMMSLQDNVGARHIRKCTVCGKLFPTMKASYHGPKCARAQHQRNRRRRHLLTLELHLSGKSPEEISSEIGSKAQSVEKWIKEATITSKLEKEGLTRVEISKKTGLAESVVARWSREMRKAQKSNKS